MPQVVGALIAGVLVGPSVLNWVGETDFLVKAAELGVIILMFNAGMDTDLEELKKTGFASFIIAMIGVIVPLLGGMGCYLVFDNNPGDKMNMIKAAFIGVVLTATSVSITVETLREMGKLKSRVGTAILGAAVIDDILGIIVLTILSALTDPTLQSASSASPTSPAHISPASSSARWLMCATMSRARPTCSAICCSLRCSSRPSASRPIWRA